MFPGLSLTTFDPSLNDADSFCRCDLEVRYNTGIMYPVLCIMCTIVVLLFSLLMYKDRYIHRSQNKGVWSDKNRPSWSFVRTKACIVGHAAV